MNDTASDTESSGLADPALDPVSRHYLLTMQRHAEAYPDNPALTVLLRQRLATRTETLKRSGSAPGSGPLQDLPTAPKSVDSVDAPNLLQDLTRYVRSHSRNPLPLPMAKAPLSAQLQQAAQEDESPVAYFRNTWSRLRVDKKVGLALELAPRNAGPINSHHLVLRSLAQMQNVSGDYLNRFVTYVDALQSLDAAGSAVAGSARTASPAVAKGTSAKPAAKRVKKT